MFGRYQEPPASVYLLADHLDAILGAGEDLLRLRFEPAPGGMDLDAADISRQNRELHDFIVSVRACELSIATHLRQARLRASDVARIDKRFASLINLFIGGTAAIVDGLAGLAAADQLTFDHGNDPIAFLRATGLISEETGNLAHVTAIAPDDTMMIAGHIQLGPLLDLTSAFLNSLDVAYDLYAAVLENDGSSDTADINATDINATDSNAIGVNQSQRLTSAPGSLASALAALDKKAK